jgi:hypothetical protein
MNQDQQKIKSLLTNLICGEDYVIKPATKEQIDIFVHRAIENEVDTKVIRQLVDLYEVADFFYYEIIIGFHRCDDPVVFDWWEDKELWLGQRDFNTLRWTGGKFCLGEACMVSFSDECRFDTLIELIEGCIRDINVTNEYDELHDQDGIEP